MRHSNLSLDFADEPVTLRYYRHGPHVRIALVGAVVCVEVIVNRESVQPFIAELLEREGLAPEKSDA